MNFLFLSDYKEEALLMETVLNPGQGDQSLRRLSHQNQVYQRHAVSMPMMLKIQTNSALMKEILLKSSKKVRRLYT